MRLKTYWYVLKNSLTNSAYYLELIKAPIWFNIRFFLISMMLLGISVAIRINQRETPIIKSDIVQSIQELKANYPPKLKINWTGSQLKTNLKNDLAISYPSQIRFKQTQLPAQLGYLTPKNKSLEQLNYDSLFVITPEQIFISNLQNSWTETPLTALLPTESFAINQTNLPQYLRSFQNWSDQVFRTFKKINYFISPLVLIISKAWIAFINSLLVYLLMKINRIRLTYKKVFRFSLHLVVIAELITQLSFWIYPQLHFPMFSLTYWLILTYLLGSNRKSISTGGKGKSS